MESTKELTDARAAANEPEEYSSDISDCDEIMSLNNYLDSDHTEFMDSYTPDVPATSQVENKAPTMPKIQIKASVTDAFSTKASTRKERKESKVDSSDTGRRRRRHRFRHRTVDEFLSSPGESINTEVEAGWIEVDDTEAKKSATDPNLTITQDFPVPKTSFSIEHPDKSQSKELEEICEDEKRHTDQLMELVKASPIIMSSLSKSMSTDFLERTKAVNAAQMQLVSALEEACSQRNPGISKIVDRLCERQSQLITYANLTPNILSVLKSKKEQPKSTPSLQSQIDLVQLPTALIAQSFDTIKRLKKTIPINSPAMVKLITAEEELFGTANNLNEFSSKLAVRKEPIKTSLVVEMKPTGPGERKLRTLFLFDDLLVSAHQRAIVFHKHFSQEDGEKSLDSSELLFDSETMSTLSEKSDPVSLQMRTRSISRYEVKWFLPLDQLDELRTDGQALDDEALRERLICIDKLKSKIKNVRAELEEEHRNADKESKRQKLRAPKIHRLRSTLYGLQAELVLQAPRLPLFLTSTDGRTYCLLMTSERERMDWKKRITQAKLAQDPSKILEKRPSSKRLSSLRTIANQLPSFRQAPRSKDQVARYTTSEVTSLINHCKTVVPLNRLGKMIISGSALSGFLQVTIHDVTGLKDVASYFIAVEVDCFGILEPVAKTRPIMGTSNPCWNQTFVIELESSQSAFFALYRQSAVIAQLEVPLDVEQLDQYSETAHSVHTFDSPPKTIQMKLSFLFTPRTQAFAHRPSSMNSDVFGLSLAEVLKNDQSRLERLQQIAFSSNAKKLTGTADALVSSAVRVPIIVTACAEEIERRGLTEEGIYRITGSLSSVNYLKEQFNRDLDTAVKHVADYDVNVLSSILKSFFRELPEPLIKWEEFIAFFNALEIEDNDERIRMLNHTLVSLPKPRRDTFQYLLCHLVRVSEYESSNKMSLNNLAMIWAMTLFQPAPEVPEGEGTLNTPNMLSMASVSAAQTRLFFQLLKAATEGTLSVTSTDF